MFAPVDRARVAHVVSPAAVALVLAGGFHLFRGAAVDGVVCLAVALAISADAARPRRSNRPFPPRPQLRGWTWIVGAGLGLVLGLLPGTSGVMLALLVLIGVAAVGQVWRGPDRPGGWPWRALSGTARARTAVTWSVLVVSACVMELAVFFLGDNRNQEDRYPALSDLLGPAFTHPVGRVLFACAWLALGWILVRVRPPGPS